MSTDVRSMAKMMAARFDALSLRERILVAMSAVAVVWLIWDWTIGQSQRLQLDRAEAELAAVQQRIAGEVAAHDTLRAARRADPGKALREEQERLRSEVAALDARLEETVGRFVPPTQMPKLLKSVVARHQGVTLVRVKSLPAEPIRVREDQSPSLFKHPLQVELDGSYFAIKSYLEDLEISTWRFAWRRLDYEVIEHPRAKAVIEIETLSPDRNWLGV